MPCSLPGDLLTGGGKKVSSCVLAHRLPGCKPRAASASLPWQAGPQAAQGASELGWGQTVVVCSWGTLSQLPSAQVCVRGLTHLDVELSLQRQGAPESVCGTPWNLSPWFSIFCWSFLFAPHRFPGGSSGKEPTCPCRRRRPSSLDDGGISGLFSSGSPSVRFLTRYLPDRGIKPGFPALQADSLPTELRGKPPSCLDKDYHRPRLQITEASCTSVHSFMSTAGVPLGMWLGSCPCDSHSVWSLCAAGCARGSEFPSS